MGQAHTLSPSLFVCFVFLTKENLYVFSSARSVYFVSFSIHVICVLYNKFLRRQAQELRGKTLCTRDGGGARAPFCTCCRPLRTVSGGQRARERGPSTAPHSCSRKRKALYNKMETPPRSPPGPPPGPSSLALRLGGSSGMVVN